MNDSPIIENEENNSKDSILISIKKLLGLPEDLIDFDTDLIININSIFMTLNQLGVGPDEPFIISDSNSKWNSFLENKTNLEAVKSYMYLKTRLLFDPPTTSFVLTSMENQIAEFEWRLEMQAKKEDIKKNDT